MPAEQLPRRFLRDVNSPAHEFQLAQCSKPPRPNTQPHVAIGREIPPAQVRTPPNHCLAKARSAREARPCSRSGQGALLWLAVGYVRLFQAYRFRKSLVIEHFLFKT